MRKRTWKLIKHFLDWIGDKENFYYREKWWRNWYQPAFQLMLLARTGGVESMPFFFFFTDPILAFPQLRLWKRERKQCRILSLFLLSSAWEVLKNFDKSRKTDKSCSYLWLNDNFMQAIVAKTFPYILWIKTHNKSEIDYRWENWVYFPSWKTIGSLTALCPDQKLGMLRDQKRTHF